MPLHFECLFVKLIFHHNKYITVGNVYRPPSAPVESSKCLISTFDSISSKNEMIILGDFNKNWLDNSSVKDKNNFENLNLTQLITEPTRITPRPESLLDWILVTHPERFIESGVLSDCFSDHSVIYCVWKIKIPKTPPKLIKIRQHKKMNIDLFINDLISINWDRYQLIPTAQDAWDFLYSVFTQVVDKHAPWKISKVKGQHLPWINPDLLSLFRQRDKAWAKFRRTRENADWETYRKLRNISKTMTRNSKSDYYKECLSNKFKNPKQFWNSIKTIINTSNKSPINKIRDGNTIIHDPSLIAQVFSQHFSTVCSDLISDFSYKYCSTNIAPCHSTFSFTKITPQEVHNAIKELSLSSGAGLDEMESKYVKLASHILMFPLADLFNLSFATCEIPAMWKYSRITPIHKGGDILDPNNYRPISIICTVAKVFEKIIFNQISHYLKINNILSPSQSGFRPNHSTTTALVKLTNDIFSASDTGNLTGAIFIDLKKAFDLVDHYLLLDKLHAIGFSQNVLLWFNSYLHNRKQCVVLKGCMSDFFVQEKGVPQGSTLGPLLFSVFINDLPSICSNTAAQLYADDTVIYTSKSNILQIQNALQLDFDAVQNWLSSNRLLLNKTKSYSMVFGTKHNLKSKSNNLIITCNDGMNLHRVEHFKYLGLWLDSELTFKPHTDSILRKINFGISVLFRSQNCFTLNVRRKLALQLILPFFDYADVVYLNTSKTNLRPLNTAYNRLCRFALGCSFYTHHCIMYNALKWPTLSIRRHNHWLQFIFKCIHSNYPAYLKQFLIPYSTPYHLRHSSQYFFIIPTVNKTIGKRAFMFKAPSDWNNLPLTIRSLTLFNRFKNALSSYLESNCTCFG